MQPITSIIQGIACLYVFYVGVLSLNKMDGRTPNDVRFAHVALVVAGAAGMVSCVAARDLMECLLAIGIALYLAGTRRNIDVVKEEV